MRDRAPDAFGEATPLAVPAGVPELGPGRVPPAVRDPQSLPASSRLSGADRPTKEYDPLRLCIYTTIGLISWLITPPLTVAVFGSIGVFGYWRARRRGLVSSRCLLGDTRLVITYLALAAIAGGAASVWMLVR